MGQADLVQWNQRVARVLQFSEPGGIKGLRCPVIARNGVEWVNDR